MFYKNKEGIEFKQLVKSWSKMKMEDKEAYADPVEEEGKKVDIWCCLIQFTKVVEDFNLDSCLQLVDSPFNYLFKLKGYKLESDLILKLVAEFDITNMTMKMDDSNKKISSKDFDDILKIGKTDMKPKKKSDRLSHDIVSRFTTERKDVCMKKVKNILKEKDNVDDLKRAFALICLRYIVCPPTGGKLGKPFLKYVENVAD